MKRKIIQLAGKTHVVSLPSKWVKKYGLKKGEEVELEDRGDSILLKIEKGMALDKVTIDVSGLDDRVVRWSLSALHKSGYDEIEVIFDSSKTAKVIQGLVKDLFMGFAIMEQTEKRCVLRSISKDSEEELDAALRRAFFVTISIGESTLDLIKKRNLSDLSDLISLEHTNNQLTNFCERILNRGGYKNSRKTSFMYVIVWNLEKICDDYKYICDYLSKNPNAKLGEGLIKMFARVNGVVRGYYEIFYKFDIKKLNELSRERVKIRKEAQGLLDAGGKKEIIVIAHLLNLLTKCMDFSASMIALNN